jgi:hypothetical protein
LTETLLEPLGIPILVCRGCGEKKSTANALSGQFDANESVVGVVQGVNELIKEEGKTKLSLVDVFQLILNRNDSC